MQQEMHFARNDLIQVGRQARKTLRVLPESGDHKARLQKVVVGDDRGVVSCFGVNKHQVSTAFSTPAHGKQISSVQLGAAHKGTSTGSGGSSKLGDKVFVACGQSISGLTRKGKEFFSMDTNMSQTITAIYVEDVDIWAAADHLMTHYSDGADKHFYMCTDRINDLLCERILSESFNDTVLACQDRCVRFVSGSELLYETALDGPPMVLDKMPKLPATARTDPAARPRDKQIVYGTGNGLVGLLTASNMEVRKEWLVPNEAAAQQGGVNCLALCDLADSGYVDLLVGRDDGSVEVYGVDDREGPRLMCRKQLGESVQSIDHGFVTQPDKREIVLGTYSGKLIALSQRPVPTAFSTAEAPSDAHREADAELNAQRISNLTSELGVLAEQVEQRKQQYAQLSHDLVAVVPAQVKVNDKLLLRPEQHAYTLSIETAEPLEMLLLQSDCPLEIDDVDTSLSLTTLTPLTPSAPMSVASGHGPGNRAPVRDKDGNAVLATCRLLAPSNRVEIKLMCQEGQRGTLNVFVMPSTLPKACQLVSYAVKPLSLHQRLPSLSEADVAGRPMNSLTLTGSFTVVDVHAWLSACLPDMPDRVQTDEATFCFESSISRCLLVCQYSDGQCVCRSESLLTLSTLKEFISKQATDAGSKYNVSIAVNKESVNYVLDLLHPQLERQLELSRKMKLLEALKELKQHNGGQDSQPDLAFLSSDYADMLANADQIAADYKMQPRQIGFYYGFIVDLYIAVQRNRGDISCSLDSPGVVELRKALDNYSIDLVKALFAPRQ
eukprot:TRINITY_DN88_c6_g1_i1.p1 TRINITY_DN88_c6_g1~~TRINITY_DN88_c6_g1_i1.p1  ORF type:complete len:780 (+),score=342.34 TRINITY_DN88_c6_g1_i1:136-2475(+)